MEELSDAESVHDYDTTQPLNSSLQNADKVPVEVMEAIKSLGIVEKVHKNFKNVSKMFIHSCFSYGLGHNLFQRTCRKYCGKVKRDFGNGTIFSESLLYFAYTTFVHACLRKIWEVQKLYTMFGSY